MGVLKENTESVGVLKTAFVDTSLYQLRKRMRDCAFPFPVNRFFAFFTLICLRVNHEY